MDKGYYPHKYKHGLPNEEVNLQEFREALSKVKLKLRQKAYVILLYWMGCRKSEPLIIYKEDIEERDGSLFISIHYRKDSKGETIPFSRAKRGQMPGAFELPLSKWGVSIIKEVWLKTRKGRKVFPFSDDTGYRAFQKVFPYKTPHHARYWRLTKFRRLREEGKMTIDDIKAATGIRRDSTIENYGLKTKAGIHKVSKLLE